ncbi:MAG: dimethylsulfonioproprionate lyase family protein [Chloroflexota bacterium]
MSAIEAGHRFVKELLSALKQAHTQDKLASNFIRMIVDAFEMGELSYRSQSLKNRMILPDWLYELEHRENRGTTKIHDATFALHPYLNWWTWKSFYPEEKYSNWVDKTLGAFAIGSEEARLSADKVTFSAENRYQIVFGGMDARTLYPLHKHRMEELYYFIAGQAELSHDGTTWQKLSAGSIYHNPPYQPHAIRTDEQAVLFVALFLPPFEWVSTMIE